MILLEKSAVMMSVCLARRVQKFFRLEMKFFSKFRLLFFFHICTSSSTTTQMPNFIEKLRSPIFKIESLIFLNLRNGGQEIKEISLNYD